MYEAKQYPEKQLLASGKKMTEGYLTFFLRRYAA